MKLNLPHFLFINGPSGSGKSTLARMICETHSEAFRESFAEPIRSMLRAVFFPDYITEIPYDLKSQDVKKRKLLELCRLEDEAISGGVEGNTPSVREAMIAFSENYMKPLFGSEIFGRLCFARCCEQTQFYSSFIIDDSGFADEAQYIVRRVGADNCHLIRLRRSGCNFSGDSRGYISLPAVQTDDLHNDGAPDEMISRLHLILGGL